MTLLLLAGLVFAGIGGTRLLHIYLTSTGRQAADVPGKQDYPVRGVDLSYYQGNIDWDVLASQGVDFCFIKATEGVDHNDSQFAQNWQTAQAAKIYVGAYHFFRFEDTGKEQAENFIRTVPVTENTLPPVIDVELYGRQHAGHRHRKAESTGNAGSAGSTLWCKAHSLRRPQHLSGICEIVCSGLSDLDQQLLL